ncbi:MAG: DMT family transporter [Pseudomonadota bacterium]
MNRPVVISNIGCFAAMAFWAISFPAVEVLLDTWGALSLIAARMTVGVIGLGIVWVAIEGMGRVRAAPWRPGLFIGALGFGAGASLLLLGQKLSDPVTTAVVAAMTPVAGALLEFLLDGRRPTAFLVGGVVLAMIGGLIATGPRLVEAQVGLGALICLASVFVYAWGTRATSDRLADVSSLARTTITSVGASVFCLTAFSLSRFLDLGEAEIGDYGAREIWLFLFYAIAGFALAQLLWLWGAARLGILLASLHVNAVPFYVMIVVVIAFGEPWSWGQAIGASLVAAGVLLAQTKGDGFRRRAAPR